MQIAKTHPYRKFILGTIIIDVVAAAPTIKRYLGAEDAAVEQ